MDSQHRDTMFYPRRSAGDDAGSLVYEGMESMRQLYPKPESIYDV